MLGSNPAWSMNVYVHDTNSVHSLMRLVDPRPHNLKWWLQLR
jgi:hypothetical protein